MSTPDISRIYTDEVGLLDVFNSANNVPDVLFALISGGALAPAARPNRLSTRPRPAVIAKAAEAEQNLK